MSEIVKHEAFKLLEENEQYKNRVQITGSTGNIYIVAQRKSNGQWSCGCFGFRRHRHCKHLDTMMPELIRLSEKKERLGA